MQQSPDTLKGSVGEIPRLKRILRVLASGLLTNRCNNYLQGGCGECAPRCDTRGNPPRASASRSCAKP
jgi:hypothetical protein